ncbi:hypothetical protein N9D99_07195 [Gammaproteobacteria bacterium]|nr:hypothetical protein [Gammaproteobacteria bacterium]MDB2444693.1 hypothetical protein [Gammaproteobacteria bacterium]
MIRERAGALGLYITRILMIALCLGLIPVTAVLTAAVKARGGDGPKYVFSGGPLRSGEIHQGVEPNWEFVRDVSTIEMQLEDPPLSRRVWVAEYDGKLYVWSGYMGTTVGRLWKKWPSQAERNNLALIRVDGVRYERQLNRIMSGEVLDGISQSITAKYPSQTSREAVEAGQVWVFELGPRNKG